MKCVYCSLSGKEIKNAEFIIKGMSLCSVHYHRWEDDYFAIEDVEKGNKIDPQLDENYCDECRTNDCKHLEPPRI